LHGASKILRAWCASVNFTFVYVYRDSLTGESSTSIVWRAQKINTATTAGPTAAAAGWLSQALYSEEFVNKPSYSIHNPATPLASSVVFQNLKPPNIIRRDKKLYITVKLMSN